MRTVVLLMALLVCGAAPVYSQKGVARVANVVKGKVGHVLQWGAIGVTVSLLLFNTPPDFRTRFSIYFCELLTG